MCADNVVVMVSECPVQKADSTLRSSRAVPHPSTNRALRRLTSEVKRDPVHSTRYGRQRALLINYIVIETPLRLTFGSPLKGGGTRNATETEAFARASSSAQIISLLAPEQLRTPKSCPWLHRSEFERPNHFPACTRKLESPNHLPACTKAISSAQIMSLLSP
jgi:hypothetical protein